MPDKPAEPVPPTFSEWVADHAHGTLDDQLTFALREVVKAVSDLQKKGSLNLKITVNPAGSGGRTVFLVGELTAKPPCAEPEASIFYVGDGGGLFRDDPYSVRIPGTVIETDDEPTIRLDQEEL